MNPDIDASLPKKIIYPKAFYFLFFGAVSALTPYLPLYYEQINLTGKQIGMLAGISPLVGLVAGPLWGALADITRRYKALLLIAISLMIAVIWLVTTTTNFGYLILIVTLFALLSNPIIPIVDATTLQMLKGRADQYGKVRLWGAVGWGLCSPIAGALAEQMGVRINFIAFTLVMVAGVLVAAGLPVTRGAVAKGGFGSSLRQLVLNPRLGPFWLIAFISGVGMSLLQNFLFLHMNVLGAGQGLMGIAMTFSTASEVVIMFTSDRLLRRFGARALMGASLLAYVLRLLALSFIQDPWLVLPLQLLHGFTFAAMWVASMHFLAENTPEGLGATAQGLFSSMVFGLGGVTGGLLGGWLYEDAGSAMLFRVGGIAMLVCVAVYGVMGRRRKPGGSALL